MPRLLVPIALACLFAFSAQARTFERLNLSLKAAGGVNNPYVYFGHRLGNGFVFVTPTLDLFENRLSLELDLGISNRVFRSASYEWGRTTYRPVGDTLYRTIYWTEGREDITQFIYAYKGVLHFNRWSLFAGSTVSVRVHEDMGIVEENQSYATGGDLNSFTVLDTEERENDSRWAWGTVYPVYGAARRFGRWSFFMQGVSIVSLQAGMSWTLRPARGRVTHR